MDDLGRILEAQRESQKRADELHLKLAREHREFIEKLTETFASETRQAADAHLNLSNQLADHVDERCEEIVKQLGSAVRAAKAEAAPGAPNSRQDRVYDLVLDLGAVLLQLAVAKLPT